MPYSPSPKQKTADQAETASDLVERLARYRERVEREGRKAAVEQLDRAIDEARRTPRVRKGL